MAPHVPEEVDVFTIPHSRMKGLVNDYAEMIKKTNFSNDTELELLLESLLRTFMEFKCHEQIENQFIMKKLKNKLKQLSIKNAAVCNCHNDDDLGRMMNFIKGGYRKKTAQDRANFGLKLVKALEDFNETFIPHMQEEEEVFQPMLLQYFTYDEMCDLKKKVIQQHITKEQQILLEQAALFKASTDNKCKASEKEEIKAPKKADICCEAFMSAKESRKEVKPDEEASDQCGIDILPPELKLRILSLLKPRDLCRMSAVNSDWRLVAKDPQLWPELYPVLWTKGNWVTQAAMDFDNNDFEDDVCEELPNMEELDCGSVLDIDADVDETEPDIVKQVKREAEILLGLAKYVLPTAGVGVKKLVLRNSRALTNGTLNRIIQHCPNLEMLDLTQTRTSDSGLKRIGKNGCGSKLKEVILAGCVNITDATLMRLAVAQHQSLNATNKLAYDEEDHQEANNHVSNNPQPVTSAPMAKMKRRILEKVEPAMLDVSNCIDSGGEKGACVCSKDSAKGGYDRFVGSDVDVDKNHCSTVKGSARKECKNDCNRQTSNDSEEVAGYSHNGIGCIDAFKNEVIECQKEFSGGDGAGNYDLDCLCEMYYRECNILIDGGCEIQTHHCRSDQPQSPNPSEVKLLNPSEMKNSCEKVAKKERAAPVFGAGLFSPSPDLSVDCDRIKRKVHPLQAGTTTTAWEMVGVDETFCHTSCCVETNTTTAAKAIPVSAIEECVPVTSNTTNHSSPRGGSHSGNSTQLHKQQSRTACYGLRHLNFSGCFQITDVGLRALGNLGTFPDLKHLDLSGCLRISGQGLSSLVDSCPNLEPSYLYYCDNIVDGPLADLASGCQNLECGNRVCCRSGD